MSDRQPAPSVDPEATSAVPDAGGGKVAGHLLQKTWLAWALIVLVAFAAYHNAGQGPFVFDDIPAVQTNKSIRTLWPLTVPLNPASDTAGADGRPLVNLTLAVNHALGGLDVRGYRAFNLLAHALAGLALFSLVRRTTLGPVCRARLGAYATPLALVTTLLWVAHPLHSESVNIVQNRSEILVSLWYFLTLYTLARGAESSRPGLWHGLSITACLLGMASKEVMVSAPLFALLYDRTFLAGSFAAAWRLRCRLYLSLAGTWLLLALLVAGQDNRSNTAGFGLGVGSWDYLLTQCQAIVLYLKLSFWPSPLVLHYGKDLVHHLGEVWWQGSLLVVLALGTIWALWRHPQTGFVALLFFAALAPSSSIIPLITQTMAEHRMYLPLAAVVTLAVFGAHAWAGRRILVFLALLVPVLVLVTVQRNRDYRSDAAIWEDCARKMPDAAWPLHNLGNALLQEQRVAEAISAYERSISLDPKYVEPWISLGTAYLGTGRPAEALKKFEMVLELDPTNQAGHYNMGQALLALGRTPEALQYYQNALRLKPDWAQPLTQVGILLAHQSRLDESIPYLQRAVRHDPHYADAHYGLAYALANTGRTTEAISHYRKSLELREETPEVHYNLALVLTQTGDLPGAIRHYERALTLKPNQPMAHNNLANVYAQSNRLEDARQHYVAALRLKPDYPEAQANLGNVLMMTGRPAGAIPHLEEALRLRPDFAGLRESLELARRQSSAK